jgi:hypothetical protein
LRETCLYCVRKHLAQAIVLNIEARLGYPLHRWLAVGHLAEAESEAVNEYPELAEKIRLVRLALMGKEGELKGPEMMALLQAAEAVAEKVAVR